MNDLSENDHQAILEDAATECMFYNVMGGMDEILVCDVAYDHGLKAQDLISYLKMEHDWEF